MTFNDLNLNNSLLSALSDLGLTQPTPIQAKSFSVAMSGKDMVGIAQTGTGKTLAYLLPCLRMWQFSKDKHPQILVIVPTRELVVQIVEEVKKLTTYMNVVTVGVYGGTNMKTQMAVVEQGLDVLVATPGRLLDLHLSGSLKMKSIKKLVIDEVDEMLSLGFRPQLIRVLDTLPPKRQNLMFSATMNEDVEKLVNDFFTLPEIVEAAPTGTPLDNITQSAYHVPNFNTKANLLETFLVNKSEFTKVLVFTGSKSLADQLYERLEGKLSDEMGVMHSNKAQNKRFETVNSFKSGEYRILIATDIIARGLDISEVSHVFNFDMPEVPETYMHRIGRTGRAEQTGIAIAFISEKEVEYQEAIEELMDRKIEILALPEDLVISDVLIEDEKPKIQMRNVQVKLPPKVEGNAAFHEKSAKNQKVNVRVSRKEKMDKKYGKPQKRKPKAR
jgi:ATP-dependent RNA helicase RhlE